MPLPAQDGQSNNQTYIPLASSYDVKVPRIPFFDYQVWGHTRQLPDYYRNLFGIPRKKYQTCYQCDKLVTYLFADSRCKDCTRLTPEEVQGIVDNRTYPKKHGWLYHLGDCTPEEYAAECSRLDETDFIDAGIVPASRFLSNNPHAWSRHYCFSCCSIIPLSSQFQCVHTPRPPATWQNPQFFLRRRSIGFARWIESRFDAYRESKGVPVQSTDSFFDLLPLSAYADLEIEGLGG